MIAMHPLYFDKAASPWAEVEEPIICGHCGDSVYTLVTVEDRDDACGYHAEVEMCESCAEGVNGR